MHAAIERQRGLADPDCCRAAWGFVTGASGEWRQVCEDVACACCISRGRTVPPLYLCADARTVPHVEHPRIYSVFERYFRADGVTRDRSRGVYPREELFHRVQTDAGFRASTGTYIKHRLIGEERNMRVNNIVPEGISG